MKQQNSNSDVPNENWIAAKIFIASLLTIYFLFMCICCCASLCRSCYCCPRQNRRIDEEIGVIQMQVRSQPQLNPFEESGRPCLEDVVFCKKCQKSFAECSRYPNNNCVHQFMDPYIHKDRLFLSSTPELHSPH